MSAFLSLLAEFTGYGISGIGALALFWVIYRMARHEILLFGSVVNETEKKGSMRYSFFVQNLEDTSFPGPINVRVTDLRTSLADRDKPLIVNLFAGPKRVMAYSSSTEGDSGLVSREWVARFDELPALDAWRIECETNASALELSIDTGDEITTVRPRLIKDISYRRLRLCSEKGSHSQYYGATVTPRMLMLVGVALALLLGYIGAVMIVAPPAPPLDGADLGVHKYDLVIMCLIAGLLLIGFLRIRRPVYPIIQGYFFRTNVTTPLRKDKRDAAGTIDE